MATLQTRLARLAKAVRERFAPQQFLVVQAVEVEHARGLAPGLYSSGGAGVLVYDPAAGEPQLPPDCGDPLLIVCEGATLDTIL